MFRFPSTLSSRPQQIIAKAMIRGVEGPRVSWVREVFLREHFVLAVLYVQLRACPVGVYGQASLDFRKMFSATKKAAELRSPGKAGDRREQSTRLSPALSNVLV